MKFLKFLQAGSTVAALLFVGSPSAHASTTYSAMINYLEIGGNVVATVSGSIDLSALTYKSVNTFVPKISSFATGAGQSSGGSNTYFYEGLTWDPTSKSFPSFANSLYLPSSSVGNLVGITNWPPVGLDVFKEYVSGASLSGSSTWGVSNFASMGMTQGTYRWTYGAGGANEFKLVVGPATGGTTGGGGGVPEPGEWAAMGVLGAGLAGLVIRKSRKV
ncbi:MAG: PEP-CTERM sorting domain-containing protein [Armatimonadaceae bacterium]